jgi:hypothetical protein
VASTSVSLWRRPALRSVVCTAADNLAGPRQIARLISRMAARLVIGPNERHDKMMTPTNRSTNPVGRLPRSRQMRECASGAQTRVARPKR